MNRSFLIRKKFISIYDLIAILMVIILFSIFSFDAELMNSSVQTIIENDISLNPINLFEYSLRTALRMLIALVCSFVFAIIYALLAVKYRSFERILIPMLDILQSVPILGYLSFTVTGFIALFPGRVLGVEMAAIFAIFTSQVWNMIFSLYQSFKTIPADLKDMVKILRLSPLEKFFKLELPFALPSLILNMVLSMSSGWFFIVASEAIAVGALKYNLPGIGSYISIALEQENSKALLYALIAISWVILIYDQILFKPLVAWSSKFKYGDTKDKILPKSIIYNLLIKTSFIKYLSKIFTAIYNSIVKLDYKCRNKFTILARTSSNKNYIISNILYYLLLIILCIYSFHTVKNFIVANSDFQQLLELVKLGSYTALRVIACVIISLIIWIPIGVFIGLRPKLNSYIQPLIQFLSAFPVNFLYPAMIFLLTAYKLNPEIWLCLLMFVGTQWYILFNIIAGAMNFSNDLKEVIINYKIKNRDYWFKAILPAVFPHIITGAITASGAAWNASIISEIVTWGDKTVSVQGIGSYITNMTNAGDINKSILGIAVLTLYVLIFNRLVWRPLYKFAEKYTKMD